VSVIVASPATSAARAADTRDTNRLMSMHVICSIRLRTQRVRMWNALQLMFHRGQRRTAVQMTRTGSSWSTVTAAQTRLPRGSHVCILVASQQ
jgi:hypothetical protein